jgi:hypothetical protein
MLDFFMANRRLDVARVREDATPMYNRLITGVLLRIGKEPTFPCRNPVDRTVAREYLRGSREGYLLSRYVPARHYISFGVVALALAAFCGWLGLSWHPAFIPTGLFCVTAGLLLFLAARPEIKVYDTHLEIGSRIIPWQDIQRVDRTGWLSPLLVKLSFFGEKDTMLVYPGEVDCCKHLLRTLRQMSTSALIDGVPWRQYWGELLGGGVPRQPETPRYRVLRPEDEEEVERLYFLLKTVGHIDPRKSGDER